MFYIATTSLYMKRGLDNMLLYIIILILIILLGAVLHKKGDKKLFFVIITFFVLTVLSAIRGKDVGIDTHLYYNFYKNVTGFDYAQLLDVRYEIGFSIVCKILNNIFKNPQFLLFISSIFINYAVFRFIYKNSDNVYISTLLYVTFNLYFSTMNIMRQSIAMAIVLLGYEYLKNDKNVKFILTVFAASLFHTSALVSLIMIFLKKLKVSRKNVLSFLIISIFMFVFGEPIFEYLANISPRLQEYVGTNFAKGNYFAALINFLIYVFVFLYGLLYINSKNDNKNLFGIISVLPVIASLSMKVKIFERIIPYFSIFIIIWIPYFISKSNNYKKRTSMILSLNILFIAYWIITMAYRPEWYGVLPYVTMYN